MMRCLFQRAEAAEEKAGAREEDIAEKVIERDEVQEVARDKSMKSNLNWLLK